MDERLFKENSRKCAGGLMPQHCLADLQRVEGDVDVVLYDPSDARADFYTARRLDLHIMHPHPMIPALRAIARERAGGRTLKICTQSTVGMTSLMNNAGLLSCDQLYLLLSDTCNALAVVHSMGLVHGALNESCIMMQPAGPAADDDNDNPSHFAWGHNGIKSLLVHFNNNIYHQHPDLSASTLRKRDTIAMLQMTVRLLSRASVYLHNVVAHLADADLCNASIALRSAAIAEISAKSKLTFQNWHTALQLQCIANTAHLDVPVNRAAPHQNTCLPLLAEVQRGILHVLGVSHQTAEIHLPMFYDPQDATAARGVLPSTTIVLEFLDALVITGKLVDTQWGLWPCDDGNPEDLLTMACFGYIVGYCFALHIPVPLDIPKLLFHYMFADLPIIDSSTENLQGSCGLLLRTKHAICAIRKGTQWFTRLPQFVNWSIDKLYTLYFNPQRLCTLADLPLSAFALHNISLHAQATWGRAAPTPP